MLSSWPPAPAWAAGSAAAASSRASASGNEPSNARRGGAPGARGLGRGVAGDLAAVCVGVGGALGTLLGIAARSRLGCVEGSGGVVGGVLVGRRGGDEPGDQHAHQQHRGRGGPEPTPGRLPPPAVLSDVGDRRARAGRCRVRLVDRTPRLLVERVPARPPRRGHGPTGRPEARHATPSGPPPWPPPAPPRRENGGRRPRPASSSSPSTRADACSSCGARGGSAAGSGGRGGWSSGVMAQGLDVRSGWPGSPAGRRADPDRGRCGTGPCRPGGRGPGRSRRSRGRTGRAARRRHGSRGAAVPARRRHRSDRRRPRSQPRPTRRPTRTPAGARQIGPGDRAPPARCCRPRWPRRRRPALRVAAAAAAGAARRGTRSSPRGTTTC